MTISEKLRLILLRVGRTELEYQNADCKARDVQELLDVANEELMIGGSQACAAGVLTHQLLQDNIGNVILSNTQFEMVAWLTRQAAIKERLAFIRANRQCFDMWFCLVASFTAGFFCGCVYSWLSLGVCVLTKAGCPPTSQISLDSNLIEAFSGTVKSDGQPPSTLLQVSGNDAPKLALPTTQLARGDVVSSSSQVNCAPFSGT